jgi:epoxyqueuosine reductase
MMGMASTRATSNPKARIAAKARELGFDSCGFTTPRQIGGAGARLEQFLAAGFHGDMSWLLEKADRRRSPETLWPETRSIIMLGMNYGPDVNPLATLAQPDRANISVYARGRDYHDVAKGRLKQLGAWLHHEFGGEIKVFVDTAPVMEKPLAQAAGLGWQGKHTNLVSRGLGSWLFLGSVFTTLDLEADAAEADHCGQCKRCLDACPTNAFPAPYRLDARRCISYLTIESKGQIPLEFRKAIGNRIYGCDDCLAVCPWNKFARAASEQAFFAREVLKAPPLTDLLALDDAAFRQLFSASPVKRAGRDRFIRNVLVAAGNSAQPGLTAHITPHLESLSALVRGMAVWALAQLLDPQGFNALKDRYFPQEMNATVQAEWQLTPD